MSDVDIVLDLDQTLLFSVFEKNNIQIIEQNMNIPGMKDRIMIKTLIDGPNDIPRGSGNIEKFAIIKRPHLKEFIDYIIQNFRHVYIWSAGHFRYVSAIDDVIFPKNSIKQRLSRGDTYIDERVVLKDLNVKGFNLSKTIMIDDRDDTFAMNVSNAIHIPVYEPNCTPEEILKDDQTLLRIIDWFKNSGVLNCVDVRQIHKPDLF